MAKSPEDIWFKSIKKKFDAAVKQMAEEMSYKIESAYESAIQQFYEDYTPSYYRRTYSTYEASSRSNDPFGFYNRGEFLESGIFVDPSFIQGNPYRADTDWVFDRTFNKGIHGFTLADMQNWMNTRTEMEWALSKTKASLSEFKRAKMIRSWEKAGKLHMIKTRFDQSDFDRLAIKLSGQNMQQQEMIAHRLKIYRGANLSYNIETSVPHTMKNKTFDYDSDENRLFVRKNKYYRTTPRKLMDKAFKNMTKKGNMKKMFNNILEQYLY